MATYTSQYPTQDADHVKTTSEFDEGGGADQFHPYYATNPALTLTGVSNFNAWMSHGGDITNQRFHIDLGSTKIIRRIYYENFHDTGVVSDRGVNNFTFWGSNTAGSFAELTYATDTGWTELTVAQNTFDQHVASDEVDPKYIVVTNTTAYRYHALKFADGHGTAFAIGVRRIELQTEDGYPPTEDNAIFFGANF